MSLKDDFKDLANEFVNNTFVDFAQTFIIEQLNKTPDGQGGFTPIWSTFATVTGFVKQSGGGEAIRDDALRTKQQYLFGMEYIAGITNDMRILYKAEYYNILPINNIMSSDIWIKIKAEKQAAT